MKKFATILCLLCCSYSYGQLYGVQWVLGDSESVLDFRIADTVSCYPVPTLENFFLTNACICDEAGHLLYYTNGIAISGVDSILENGNGLNPCPNTDQWVCCGLNIPQAALFIPQPDSERYYYLFHFSNDLTNEGRPSILYYSKIDRLGNNGQGTVIAKNVPILQGTMLHEGGMTACKHANGRDYWLVIGASNINTYFKFLLTPNGILGPYIQNIGPAVIDTGDVAYSKFTLDGSKYAIGFYAGPTIIMDFDRCSGDLSNVDSIYNNVSNNPVNDPIEGCASLEFSPNDRFLYGCNSLQINQYDLLSAVPQDSVAIYNVSDSDVYQMDKLQIGPNGKLYCSTWGGGLKALHVINYPDLKGDSCNFVYGGQPTLTINSITVPNMINYQLGPLLGSGCDTLPNAITAEASNLEVRVLPNPANKYAYVEMGAQGNYEFDLINIAGQLIAKKETRQVDIFDTENLAAGVYFLRVTDKTTGAELPTKKVVVVH